MNATCPVHLILLDLIKLKLNKLVI